MTAPYSSISTQIIYGKDSLLQLGEVARKLKVDKAQVITDPGVAGLGVLDQVLAQLNKAEIELRRFRFGRGQPNGRDGGQCGWRV